jgi:hypothetical protein
MPTQAGSQTNDHIENSMHGAAIVNDKGEETPITESMIETALQSILKAAQS